MTAHEEWDTPEHAYWAGLCVGHLGGLRDVGVGLVMAQNEVGYTPLVRLTFSDDGPTFTLRILPEQYNGDSNPQPSG